jgi:hypothetical protein
MHYITRTLRYLARQATRVAIVKLVNAILDWM